MCLLEGVEEGYQSNPGLKSTLTEINLQIIPVRRFFSPIEKYFMKINDFLFVKFHLKLSKMNQRIVRLNVTFK